ncbi:S8 family serine peptidase [Galbibacter mesophilus]|uniref:S8 family serine peptidase n=1 Tax=Galbibacter mesophilus TaxID=379069 RepID=UPI00191E278B|nr:S8 family serine peptidase [Galbibacter mesophilus]MCM5662158.1 S8 family serine peptidase [Galbibacter mesophilus]
MKTILQPQNFLFAILTAILFFNSQFVTAQHTFQKVQEIEGHHSNALLSISKKLKSKAVLQKKEAQQIALSKGWEVSKKLPNGGYMELEKIGPDGAPIYFTTFNDNVVYTSRSNSLYRTGDLQLDVDGLGMYVGVWDSGNALLSHQEFSGRIKSGDDSKRTSGHATHVLGTIIASGVDAKAKGVAYNAEGVTFDWSNDEAEVAEAAANGMLLSNHSYGISGRTIPDWYFGAYIYQAQEWDEIMYNAPYYLMVTAAGNTQQYQYNEAPNVGTAADAYDLLLGYAVAKNGLTVAAADNVVLDENENLLNADIASFSNFGPTDDGRIKPDITGEGVDVYSAYDDSNASYIAQSGTSMAAPGVTGSLLLLQQYYKETHNTFMKAATLKGLALHTADEAGDFPGPDYRFGWGIINTKKAAETISNAGFESEIIEESLQNGNTFSMEVEVEKGQTLMASISWTDLANPNKNEGNLNDATAVLVNDLDIVITKEGEDGVFYPWKLSVSDVNAGAKKGVNNVDPFEKIEIPNATGTYKITVTHKGNLATAAQDFSLIVTGVKGSDCVLDTPKNLIATEAGENEATLGWDFVQDAIYEVAYRAQSNNKSAENNWNTVLTSENTTELNELSQNTVYEWKVRTLCSALAESDYSEVKNFKTKFVDVEAPNMVEKIEASAITQSSFQLSWDAAKDNVATTLYNVYLDGIKLNSVAGTSVEVTSLQSNTLYTLEVEAVDAAGNTSEKNTFQVKTLSEENLSEVLVANDFENGIGNWSAAGIWGASKGKYSLDNSIAASSRETGNASIVSPSMNLLPFERIIIDFHVLATSDKNNDKIVVSINNGNGWDAVESYIINQDIEDGYFYQATLAFTNKELKFSSNTKVKVETQILNHTTSVYLDNISVRGFTKAESKKSSLDRLAAMDASELLEAKEDIRRINVYPNPTVNSIKINGLTATNDAYQIYNSAGTLVNSGNGFNKMIDVSRLPAGMYIVTVQQDGTMSGTKFVKN